MDVGSIILLVSALIVAVGIVRKHMSSREEVSTNEVVVPVPSTGTSTEEVPVPQRDITPVPDDEKVVPASRYLTREQLIILLASQRKVDISASKIFAMFGGNRAEVLAEVKAIKETATQQDREARLASL